MKLFSIKWCAVLVVGSLAGSLLGCPATEEVEAADAEGCEHLQDGPAKSVTAIASGVDGPLVAGDHHRYDITLVEVAGGQKGGSVKFAAPESTDYVVYLNADVAMTVRSSTGTEITPEEVTKSSSGCAEIKARYVLPLDVGSYEIALGPTSAATVGMVLEEAAHEHE